MDITENFEKWFTGNEKPILNKTQEGHYVLATAYSAFNAYKAGVESQQAEITRLTAEVQSYKVDAERYRWLREQSSDSCGIRTMRWEYESGMYEAESMETLDSSIDQAMQTQLKEYEG